MAFKLKNGESRQVDIGNSSGIDVRNLLPEEEGKVHNITTAIDYQLPNGQWSAITGTVTIAAGKSRGWTRIELGHDKVRVGVHGPDDGRDIAEVTGGELHTAEVSNA